MNTENIILENARSDSRAWLCPIWEGDTVYCETGMFLGKEDRLPLLFQPTQILYVSSYDGSVTYENGVDFFVTPDGKISLTENTRIPFITAEEFYHNDPTSILKTMRNGKEVFTYWGDGDLMTKYQICVTYSHAGADGAYRPPCRRHSFEKLISKLRGGEDITILVFGDSITTGATCSYNFGAPPFMPSYAQLTVDYIAQRYGYTVNYIKTELEKQVKVPDETSVFGNRGFINYINTAVGGWNSAHAVEHFDERVGKWAEKYGCDLFIFAFGMNDGSRTPAELCSNFKNVFDRLLDITPSASILAVSTMLPNTEATNGWYKNQNVYEDEMLSLAKEYENSGVSCVVAPVTSMSRFVAERKRFRDHSANNINHPNDFMMRLYAQTVIETLVELI